MFRDIRVFVAVYRDGDTVPVCSAYDRDGLVDIGRFIDEALRDPTVTRIRIGLPRRGGAYRYEPEAQSPKATREAPAALVARAD